MTYLELLQTIKKLGLQELRKDSPDYLEFVIRVDQMSTLSPVLEKYFGTPFKPAGKRPSKEDEQRTQAFGGIRDNQILYFVEREGSFYCALLWPWSDGQSLTVKVAQLERKK